jgi:hypothetical protein
MLTTLVPATLLLQNMYRVMYPDGMPAGVRDWLKEQLAWARRQVDANPGDAFWRQTGMPQKRAGGGGVNDLPPLHLHDIRRRSPEKRA